VSLTPSHITLGDRWKHARRCESLSEVNSLYILGFSVFYWHLREFILRPRISGIDRLNLIWKTRQIDGQGGVV